MLCKSCTDALPWYQNIQERKREREEIENNDRREGKSGKEKLREGKRERQYVFCTGLLQ